MEIIKTQNLTKYYGNSLGIKNLNLNVKEGDIFGFIGPNGAGKSTTIRTLLGLIAPTDGEAYVLGKSIRENNKDILANIGYLPSEANFYSGMKASEIISLSAKLYNKDCKAEAKILCDRLGLDASKKVEELSLGNRKKVGIICALQHNPKLYIFDEPTSGLDPLMQKEFFDILKEKNKKGATIFLSSHILSEIQRYCNTAAIIRKGEIIACDSVSNLSKSNAKNIILHTADEIEMFDGMKNINKTENALSFLYSGDINLLISELAKYKINDITITEPELDEIFMHYYKKEEK